MKQINKIEAAVRLLNASIKLFFRKDDPIVIHNLAMSASTIMSDVLDQKPESQSWRERIKIDHKLIDKDFKKIFNKSWNFFKHGENDPEGILEFDEIENEHILFFASLECGELGLSSIEKDVFQIWYYAVHNLIVNDDIMKVTSDLFPNLKELSKNEQINIGLTVLLDEIQNTL